MRARYSCSSMVKKLFDKLTAAMQPEFEDEEAIDPFDFWQGANFKLKAKNCSRIQKLR